MLCPECQRSAPGGARCPDCGMTVPEREAFGGHGGHYLRILLAASGVLLLVLLGVAASGPGVGYTIRRLYVTGWMWPFLAIVLLPAGVGVYYWAMLREEEVIVTDDHIARSSHWGDESLRWVDVRVFRRQQVPWRYTRLGRIAELSRFFTRHRRPRERAKRRRIPLNAPAESYELIGPPDQTGEPTTMLLEPGTIADMPWLLQLIQERLGPPVDDV